MTPSNVLGLDIGEKRIGVARVNLDAKIPEPLCTIENNSLFLEKLNKVLIEEDIGLIVVGLPRNMSGQETKQSEYIRKFVDKRIKPLDIEHIFFDETLSSVSAQERIDMAKKAKFGIDAVAASIILEDYLKSL